MTMDKASWSDTGLLIHRLFMSDVKECFDDGAMRGTSNYVTLTKGASLYGTHAPTYHAMDM